MKLAAILLLALATGAQAEGRVLRIPTRPDVSTTVYWEPVPGATATVLLMAGGRGGFGGLENGRPGSANFLIRSIPHFVARRVNVAALGRPSDRPDLDPYHRLSAEHVQDIRAVVARIRQESGQKVWLVGTSRGSTSAASAAIAIQDGSVAGLVLSSSITSQRDSGSVALLGLAAIRVPVLVIHHEKDECRHTLAHEVSYVVDGLKNAPAKKLVIAKGGADPTGDECGPYHRHGYEGMEREAVASIAAFIRGEGDAHLQPR